MSADTLLNEMQSVILETKSLTLRKKFAISGFFGLRSFRCKQHFPPKKKTFLKHDLKSKDVY